MNTILRRFSVSGMALVTALSAGNAFAYGAGDLFTHFGIAKVSPTSDNGHFGGLDMDVDVDDDTGFAFTLGYRFLDKWGVELLAAEPFEHDIDLNGNELASTKHLPPTLTLQYHLAPDSNIRPYVGAGINYSIFYSTKAGDALEAAVGPTKVKLNDSVGYALQAGVDIDITPKFFFNFDVKYIDMDPKARLNSGGAINTTRFHIDPVVVGIGLGTRF